MASAMRDVPPAAPAPADPVTLKAFITANATLITIFSVLSGLAAFALSLGFGWFGPVLRMGLLLLAVIVWFELLQQFPPATRLSNIRAYPSAYEWRLVWFSYLVQALMAALLLAAALAFPTIVGPGIAAVAAGVAASRLPDRIGGLARLLMVLLVFEIALVIFHPNHQGVLGWLFERQG